jgi:hypothetical protein
MVHMHRKFESRETMSEKGSQRESRGRLSPKLSTDAYALLLLLPFVAAGLSSKCARGVKPKAKSDIHMPARQVLDRLCVGQLAQTLRHNAMIAHPRKSLTKSRSREAGFLRMPVK